MCHSLAGKTLAGESPTEALRGCGEHHTQHRIWSLKRFKNILGLKAFIFHTPSGKDRVRGKPTVKGPLLLCVAVGAAVPRKDWFVQVNFSLLSPLDTGSPGE